MDRRFGNLPGIWPDLFRLLLWYLGGILLGGLLSLWMPHAAGTIAGGLTRGYQTMAVRFGDYPVFLQIIILGASNLVACLTAVAAGMFFGPRAPLVFLVGNGFIIGVFQQLFAVRGVDSARFYASLALHGFPELFAYLLAVNIGIGFGRITRCYRQKYREIGPADFVPGWVRAMSGFYRREAARFWLPILILLGFAAVLELSGKIRWF